MARPSNAIIGASCLAHLCVSSNIPGDESLLDKARNLSKGFYNITPVTNRRNNRIQFVNLEHTAFELIIFPSSTRYDWLGDAGNLNMNWTHLPLPGYEVEGEALAGFVSAVDEMWPDLNKIFNQSRKKVVFLGLSRGGACAVISALKFGDNSRLGAVVTFGQPRCVKRSLAQEVFDTAWKDRYFRFAGTRDPVPLLPRDAPRFSKRGPNDITHDGRNSSTLIQVSEKGTRDYRDRSFLGRLSVLHNAYKDVGLADALGSGHQVKWYCQYAAYREAELECHDAMSTFICEVIGNN